LICGHTFIYVQLTFYGFETSSPGSCHKSGKDIMSDADFEKTNSENENNEDESSQDSGVGTETSTGLTAGPGKGPVVESNSLDRWVVGEKRQASQWTVPSLHRSMSMPATAEVCLVAAAAASYSETQR
jgi:hypothetical protein